MVSEFRFSGVASASCGREEFLKRICGTQVLPIFPRGRNPARFFATEKSTEGMAIAREAVVNFFGNPNHSWNPEQKRERNQQRNSHRDKTNTPRGAINFSIVRDAVHCLQQLVVGEIRRDPGGAWIGNGHKVDPVKPVQPCQPAHLPQAKRATVVVKEDG